jgi:hypothetical protein
LQVGQLTELNFRPFSFIVGWLLSYFSSDLIRKSIKRHFSRELSSFTRANEAYSNISDLSSIK